MSKTWLLIDCRYMCYRSFHTLKDLSYEGIKTGVIYGFLKDIVSLQNMFDTHRVVFVFDVAGYEQRRKLFPGYKKKRHSDQTEEEKIARAEMEQQINDLRCEHLPRIGFRNVLAQRGFEADDIIASLVFRTISDQDRVVIVSADKDFYQLLRGNVMLYAPSSNKRTTMQSFYRETGLRKPSKWARVLAMAGCHTDEIPGIGGVGNITAIKYLTKKLATNSAVYAKIKTSKAHIKRNLALVKLPLHGTDTFCLRKDVVTLKGWRVTCKRLGMRSILDFSPKGAK